MTLSDNLRGIGLMCLSMAAFTINDTFMKSVTVEVPLFQTVFLRGLVALVGLSLYALWVRAYQARLSGRDWGMVALRSVAEILATISFLTALLHMQIANLSAIMQFLPLAVTLVAALVFGDRIGWRRMLAILAGFVGVMIIIRPGTEHFDIWSVLGVLSVACVVVRDLVVRRMGAHIPSATVAIGAALSVAAMGLVLSLVPLDQYGEGFRGLSGWVPIDFGQALRILGAGGFLIVGYLCAVTSMRWGDIGVVAPFRYTSLLWAIVLGLVVFGQFPDGWTLVGSAIVVASGIYTLLRERALARARIAASRAPDKAFS
jgi:drug/metabolite transporter (DMT)-like permease